MLAFVDESGCMGMKLGHGSSPHFGVVAVLFEDHHIANQCDKYIEELRKVLRIRREFHFTKCSHEQRSMFFGEAVNFDFSYVGIVFDKQKIFDSGMTFSRPFLQYPVKGVFATIEPRLRDTIVVIDRTGSSEFRKMMARDLKNDLNAQFGRQVIKLVKDEASHSNNLLQMADMICSAVTRSFRSDRKEPKGYRDQIRRKELLVQVWPSA